MNPKLKKIIAREGLIFSGFALAEIFLIVLGYVLGGILLSSKVDSISIILILGFYVVPVGYPLHLFVRFIIWAIKTLKEK